MPSWTIGVSASWSEVIRSAPRSSTSHAQPLAKWLTASSLSLASMVSALPNASSIRCASLPSGFCSLAGARHCQKKLWFHSCALLLNSLLSPFFLASRTTWRIEAPFSPCSLWISSLVLLTYALWCLPWWYCSVSADMYGASASSAKGSGGRTKAIAGQLLICGAAIRETLSPRLNSPPGPYAHACRAAIFNPRNDSVTTGCDEGGSNEQVFRESRPGIDHRAGADRGGLAASRFRLPAADRRPGQRPAAVAARLLRHHLDRPALLFQFRPNAGHADGARGTEAGRVEIYRAQGPVLFPLGRRLHGADGPAAGLVLR